VIEQGFVQFVQGAAGVNTIAATGGFLAELPKDQALPSWSYTTVADSADYVLAGPVDLGSWNVQIHTVVQGIFRINKRDFFDDARRTYRRMLEYEVWSNS
jgi:hypothetical protein